LASGFESNGGADARHPNSAITRKLPAMAIDRFALVERCDACAAPQRRNNKVATAVDVVIREGHEVVEEQIRLEQLCTSVC
jgi:hypothetical protein